ncbi:ubiquinol oxidase subunit II [Chromobacterium paludis]|uniref:Ubiquinol oxidase subunit 2 n=1 Tax=Chromobacterium paludis TaxID=2605945 RepID=A0A5C1DMA8_9NEIS|nr:ubiquinol oxidase subunit II [Chromobacterium paludis]QEL54100.1 ubiquinol oxidase subunit II [Chromobacterium paludis]QEL57732.1 ubiquinol oxidase subunit II [Chromobacterium paludis]
MRNHRPSRLLWGLSPLFALLLSGCQGGILDPKGPVAAEQKSLIITATALMLLVVIPVIVMTLVFAWKYRASNKDAAYEPKWSHSTKIELVVWLIPCVIIAFLATLTWHTTHKLDPYRPLDSDKKPIQVQVVALNWKWLFIYPEQQIATVNELVFPADTPVNFKITSDAAMNSFFIPQLGGQIYAMAGMQTQLHLLASEPGTYHGFSSNYSGAGFSGMKFNAIATKTPAEFDAWVAKVKASGQKLDAPNYLQLLKPSEKNPVAYYASTTPYLFEAVLHKYMAGRPSLADSDDAIKLAKMTKELCAAITPPVVKE